MWIVRLALRRPYTVAVMSLLIMILGVLSLRGMIVDIFPSIDIPVVGVIWNYPGLSADEMEKRVVFLSERAFSTTVGGIDHIESQSIPGTGLLKIYFQPGTNIGAAMAQITAISNTVLRIMPAGMGPPVVVQSNASNVPVAQLTISSKTMPEEQIFDYGLNFVRLRLFTIPGLATPAPYGGKNRQVSIDLNTDALAAKGLSPADVVQALQASNIILPAGTARIGSTEYNVALNSSPTSIEAFNDIPVRVVNGAPVTIGDVARVYDGFADQTNIVHVNGTRATYLAILKKADASTLAVVEATRDMLPAIQAAAPNGMEFHVDFDQSVFVKAAINSVLFEAIIAAALVSLMILLFLGSWRSVVIVCTSIPLAILTAIICLNLTGNSINIMTLGGLSLAIGMLVDDATVEVENIHRNRRLGKPLTVAILDGAQQIAVPAIVATLAICVVFSPVELLTGPSRFLFTPMALAVVVAMLASYLLSRTLVPTLARMLMASERHDDEPPPHGVARLSHKFNAWRDRVFTRFQESYGRLLALLLHHRVYTLVVAAALLGVTAFLPGIVGEDFFPATDAGLMRLHFRAPSGSRIENTDSLVLQVEQHIREIIPKNELQSINDLVGVPTFYNLAFVSTDNASGMDAEILVSLNPNHKPTVGYMRTIRKTLARDFPGCATYFQSADIVSQVLNFGLSAPIDVQIEYGDLGKSYPVAREVRDAVRSIAGTADVNIKQVLDYPTLQMHVDRQRAAELGISQRDVANSMLIALSTSSMVAPSYFLSPKNSVNYLVVVKTPTPTLNSVQSLMNTPVTPASNAALLPPSVADAPTSVPGAPTQTLGSLASMDETGVPSMYSHYTVQRVLNVTANVEGRDLGSVVRDIHTKLGALTLPKGMKITVRGQDEVMERSFSSLGLGMILAVALVYLLMVVLYQSWLDPFIIMIAVIGALMGILWMLALTGTTINVVSLMGSIMAVGIAVSNSILLVTFANDVRVERPLSSLEGALEAGKTRLRPVLMTALAMIMGMLPMALGLGEGGEQNAPLGRAVIGGLLLATPITLLVVPVIYSLLRKKLPTKHLLEEQFRRDAAGAMSERDLLPRGGEE